MDTFTHPVLWAVIGVLLIIAELFVPSFVIIFFGAAALVVALLTVIGLLGSLTAQLITFAVVSVVSIVFLRARFQKTFLGHSSNVNDRNDPLNLVKGARVRALSAFVDGEGTVSYRGASWRARSEEPIAEGDTLWVVGSEGIILLVSRDKPATN